MKIGICGTGDTLIEAPFDDPSWTLWTCGLGADDIYTRWDRHFQLHDLKRLCVGHMRIKPEAALHHINWLKTVAPPKIVMMQKAYDAIPASERYPIEEVQAHFGEILIDRGSESFFRCMPAYMLAWAIMQKPDEIGCWGVDVTGEREYADQRPNVTYFIGWARGAGIPVRLPQMGSLCRSQYMYGYDDQRESKMLLTLQRNWERREEVTEMADNLDTQAQAVRMLSHRYTGAAEALRNGKGMTSEDMAVKAQEHADVARDLELKAVEQRLLVSRIEGAIDAMTLLKEDRI